MYRVVTAQGARETDAHLINDCKIPGLVLMENAARSVTERILAHGGRAFIVCGGGNNGGDGFCIHRQLCMYGRESTCVLLGDTEKLTGDALTNYNAAVYSGCEIFNVKSIEEIKERLYENHVDIIVDALFGTGLCREITGLYADCIELINSYNAYKIAVDIPSGVSADDGRILGTAFRADETITFQNVKRGQILYPGKECCGKLHVSPIGIEKMEYNEFLSEESDLAALLPKRSGNSHKGTHGKVLIIGGADEYAGAIVLAAVSAQRSGAGLVKVICKKRAADAILQISPEIMTVVTDRFDDNIQDIDKHMAWADCIAFGMGAGHDEGTEKLIKRLIASGKPLVIDADGLNCMAEHTELLSLLHDKCVLTPHVGEFSRLTGQSIEEITDNFAECARAFATKHNTNLHLKSAVSITAAPCGALVWNNHGNSGLAKGGSGDTLSGLIASLCAQGITPHRAAYTAALFLGVCAERAGKPAASISATDISGMFSECMEHITGKYLLNK